MSSCCLHRLAETPRAPKTVALCPIRDSVFQLCSKSTSRSPQRKRFTQRNGGTETNGAIRRASTWDARIRYPRLASDRPLFVFVAPFLLSNRSLPVSRDFGTLCRLEP